jgi:serine/threonine-protein kinase
MTADARSQALDAAREAERLGQVDAAVRAYLRAGAVAEAARVLVAAKRHAEAGHLVMESLGVGPGVVGSLDAERKALAAKAAMCFAQAGEWKRAQELFVGLGDLARGAEAAERGGDGAEAARIRARIPDRFDRGSSGTDLQTLGPRAAAAKLEQVGQHEAALAEYVRLKAFADAGRVAYKLKRFAEAGPHFEAAGKFFEAAACFAEAGNSKRCLEVVIRVPREHPKYRLAAAQAMRLSAELGIVDLKLDLFLWPLVSDGPRDDREAEAFYMLAKLYQGRSLIENAREVYAKLSAARPGYRDVAEQVTKLATAVRGPRPSYGAGLADESVARADSRPQAMPLTQAPPPDDLFPELPELPAMQLPPVVPATTLGPRPAVSQPAVASAAAQPAVPAPPAQPWSPSGEPAVGSTVAERYRIDAKIGQGGTAAVYRATDLELGEEIALKVFIQNNDDPQLLARFKQELLLSRGLAHPNIVRLYDIGQHQGNRFLTMELLHGTDLADVIGGRPVELARGLRYMIQACSGLALAHSKGIIHRDIKPANFFITRDDTLKVMDFGIAKRTAQAAGMTQTGFIAGTPAYMSPEQINNFATVTHLTDMYALGIVAYEVFTGTLPYEHEELVKLLMMHLMEPPPPPRTRNPDLPPELDQVILRLLEKTPGNRVQSCGELSEILGAIADML